ncbi:MAG: hypothetical protein ACOY3X_07115 [Pseudomonadota bacterium]
MDQQTLQKLSRLRILAGKEGKEMDLVRFVSDRDYAREALTRILSSDKEDVVLLGMEVMDIMGLIPAQPAAAPAAGPKAEEPAPDKYVRSLR